LLDTAWLNPACPLSLILTLYTGPCLQRYKVTLIKARKCFILLINLDKTSSILSFAASEEKKSFASYWQFDKELVRSMSNNKTRLHRNEIFKLGGTHTRNLLFTKFSKFHGKILCCMENGELYVRE